MKKLRIFALPFGAGYEALLIFLALIFLFVSEISRDIHKDSRAVYDAIFKHKSKLKDLDWYKGKDR